MTNIVVDQSTDHTNTVDLSNLPSYMCIHITCHVKARSEIFVLTDRWMSVFLWSTLEPEMIRNHYLQIFSEYFLSIIRLNAKMSPVLSLQQLKLFAKWSFIWTFSLFHLFIWVYFFLPHAFLKTFIHKLTWECNFNLQGLEIMR